jgi:protein MpaA
MTEHRPRSERGQLAIAGENYGSSLLGAPLLYFPAAISGPETGLIIAGTHGDESAAIVTLSCALRSIAPERLRHHVVLAVNPDGCQLGLRANANGVDLCHLIHRLKPHWVVSFHEPLACIEDPASSRLGVWLSHKFELPLVTSVGYETPGSFGSWCADLSLPCITAEFPPISADAASERYIDAMIELLTYPN